jgi:D-threo-aldose 1-dehydrogenase
MKEIELKGTGIRTTAVGFGCGGLMRLITARSRQNILQEAFDAGVRHFDTARMYGLGKAEGELGRFTRGRRDDVVITTKFGIEAVPVSPAKAAVYSLARIALKLFPRLRGTAQRNAGDRYLPRNYGPENARESLEKSLRELDTDYVDLFLLHEPMIDSLRSDDVHAFLDDAKQKGLIRAWGVAGYPEQIRPVCETWPHLAGVIQLPNDIVGRQLNEFRDLSHSAFITFSPYADALAMISEHLAGDSPTARRWSDAVGADLSDSRNICRLLLGYCLQENTEGLVLFFSARREGIQEMASVVRDGVDADAICALEQLVQTELGEVADQATTDD